MSFVHVFTWMIQEPRVSPRKLGQESLRKAEQTDCYHSHVLSPISTGLL